MKINSNYWCLWPVWLHSVRGGETGGLGMVRVRGDNFIWEGAPILKHFPVSFESEPGDRGWGHIASVWGVLFSQLESNSFKGSSSVHPLFSFYTWHRPGIQSDWGQGRIVSGTGKRESKIFLEATIAERARGWCDEAYNGCNLSAKKLCNPTVHHFLSAIQKMDTVYN